MPDAQDFIPSESLKRAVDLSNRGLEFHQKDDLDAAKFHYLAAMLLEPNVPAFVHNVGAVLTAQEHYEVAEVLARKVLDSEPENVGAMMNLAVALTAMRRFTEAKKEFRKILKLDTQRGDVWHNYGLVEITTGNLLEARAAFDKAVEFPGAPTNDVLSDRALTILSLGDIQLGLKEYEIRWKKLYQSPSWNCGAPEWQGEDLNGKSILIHGEQGYGDSLMLCRWAQWFATSGARVTLAFQPALVRLMRRNFPEFSVINWEEASSRFDYHTPMLSMLRWIGVKSPQDVPSKPYLSAEGYSAPIQLPSAQMRIGICWASGDHSKALRRRRRVVALEAFAPLLGVDGLRLISLQKGAGEEDISRIGADSLIFDPMPRCKDFADTATIIRDLDFIISVDSAVAHLAGAMGKPVLMLSPYTRCWRWWNTDKKSGKPWYEKMTIVPQAADGSWREAMGVVLTLTRRFMESQSWQRSQASSPATTSSTPSPTSRVTQGLLQQPPARALPELSL